MTKSSWNVEPGDYLVPGRIVHQLLGGGIAYEAYLAFDEELYTAVVVKVLRPDLAQDERSLRQMRREARMLDRLRHPVIVRSFGAHPDGARPHLVLEHLEGPRLSRLLRKFGPLPMEQLLPLALEIAAALHYLQGQGIVHLDVKPSNIIMGAPARLIDMSLARTVEVAAELTYVVGTDYYLAPEQALPTPEEPPGPPADVWGLGVTLFESVAGHLPWPAEDFLEDEDGVAGAYPQVDQPPRELPRTAPGPLAELILACLARRPAERPTAAEVADAMEPLIARLPKPVLAGFRPRLARR